MSDKSNLQKIRNPKDQLALQNSGLNSGRLLDIAVSNLDDDEIKALRNEALKARLELEKDEARRTIAYNNARNEIQDHIDLFDNLDKNGNSKSHKISSNIKTGAGNIQIESKSGGTCFVASAAYDDPNHPDVVFLRHFRDTKLKTNILGRTFIAFYWKLGPVLANPVSRIPILQHTSRRTIEKIVQVLKAFNNE